MQTPYASYHRLVAFWKKIFPFAKAAHPAAGMGKKEKGKKRKDAKPLPLVHSPESVRLRGPQNSDPQRRNPAP